MKIIALIGSQPNHKYLCECINNAFGLEAVVMVNKKSVSKNTFLSRAINKIISLPFSFAWRKMQASFQEKLKGFVSVKSLMVDDINSQEVLDLMEEIAPELVVISGTNLLKAELIRKISLSGKIMNLHTGLSPYVKGGPNCTNWCLANKEFHFIGNTIMWLNEGIDSGNLILTERTTLLGSESLLELHKKVMTHGHELFMQCIESFTQDKNLPDVNQEKIDKGRVFYTKQWTSSKVVKAYTNFLFHYRVNNIKGFRDLEVITIGGRKDEQ